jgi:hypothetical protein
MRYKGHKPVEVEESMSGSTKIYGEIKGSRRLNASSDTGVSRKFQVQYRENVTWSISSKSIITVGFGTNKRYLIVNSGFFGGNTSPKDTRFPRSL